MIVAIPSEAPGGVDAVISEHFGHCAAFTLVHVVDGEIGKVEVVQNVEHEQGGCMAPVKRLKDLEVDKLVSGGMGMRPLAGFRSVGIAVHSKQEARTVGEAVKLFIAGGCPEFDPSQTCGGGGGHCGSHHQEPVERAPIEGPADVRDGRVVTLDYEMADGNGDLLDSSAHSGPMQYLQGSGGIVGLEKALSGLEAGAAITVEVSPSEGFGEYDETKIMEVPRGQVPADLIVGEVIAARAPDGQLIRLVTLAIDDTTVRLDGNHPLAGKTLVFRLTVTRVESATPEEIQHGHAH